jgi:hypothetical protein
VLHAILIHILLIVHVDIHGSVFYGVADLFCNNDLFAIVVLEALLAESDGAIPAEQLVY